MDKFFCIRALRDAGKNYSQIAKELNIDRKTVAKYIKSNTPPSYKKRERSTREDPTHPFFGRIEALIEDDKMLAVDIYELLVEEGYKGSERTIRRRVTQLRSSKDKERYFEQIYQPAEQSQFDFKEKIEIPFKDGLKKIYLHFGTLPCSDHFFISSYPRKNFECFIEGIHRFFEDIGGLSKNIRIDNLSPCVSKVYKGRRRKYTDSFERAINYYGFGVLPCSPGKGNEKGDVERDIRTHSRRILRLIKNKNIIFEDFEHLNTWLISYRDKRLSDEMKRKFAEEKPYLNPLPKREESILNRIEEIKANSYGSVKVGDYYYSVPDHTIHHTCKIVAGAFDIKIYKKSENLELVATHLREKGDSISLEHILPSLLRKPQGMLRWKDKNILFPDKKMEIFYQKLKNQNKETAEREYLRVLNLIQHTALEEIILGMDLILKNKKKISYEGVRELILVENYPDNIVHLSKYRKQEPLEIDLTIFDELLEKESDNEPI